MKKVLTVLSAALFLAACSTPKYTYHFDHYDYSSGKKNSIPVKQSTDLVSTSSIETLAVDEKTLVASTDEKTMYIAEEKKPQVVSKKEIADKINAMSKEERKELKKEVKKYVKESKNVKEAQARPSGDLKLAIIFGVAGIILLIVLGDLLWLGTIAVLIGLFFLIRWMINN